MLVTASFIMCLSSALACVADKGFCYLLGKDYSAEQKITWTGVPSTSAYEFEFEAVGSDITVYTIVKPTSFSPESRLKCGKVAAGQRSKLICSGHSSGSRHKIQAVAESSSVTAQVCLPLWTYAGSWHTLDYSSIETGTRLPEFSPVKRVLGQWVRIAQITTETEVEYTVGTSFTETTSTSEEFTQAMTHATSQTTSFTLEVGFEDKFVGGSSTSVETTTSQEWTNEFMSSFTQESSSTFSKEEAVTYIFSTDMIGKTLWQFKIATVLCSDSNVETASRDIALTGSPLNTPCCYPGHCRDQKSHGCSYCHPGFRIRTTSDCFEGEPPCLEKTVQLSNVNEYVTIPSMATGEKTMSCPSPFEGTIKVACEDQALSIQGENCRNPTWSHGEWGVCSEPCGGGSQTRTVTCSSPDGLCSGTRPESQQTCNTQQCIWLQGSWTTCSEVCAGGVRSRTVECQRLGFCLGSQPPSEEACNTETCQWYIGSWHDCSQPCGGGVRSRTVECQRLGFCVGSQPPSEETCNTETCQWSIGSWHDCSQPCGGGVRSRSISCPRSGYCDDTSKPEADGTCNMADCQWSVGEWSKCSKRCGGGGYQRRTVDCPRPGSCRALRPNSSESCYEGPCFWEVEPWSSCSRVCEPGFKERRVWCPYVGECQGTAPRDIMNCTGDDGCSILISGCPKASNTWIFEVLLMFGTQSMLFI